MLVAVVVLAALLALVAVSRGVRRYGESPAPSRGWTATDEVFLDPSTGRRMRVWVDPADRSRHYVPEGRAPDHR